MITQSIKIHLSEHLIYLRNLVSHLLLAVGEILTFISKQYLNLDVDKTKFTIFLIIVVAPTPNYPILVVNSTDALN